MPLGLTPGGAYPDPCNKAVWFRKTDCAACAARTPVHPCRAPGPAPEAAATGRARGAQPQAPRRLVPGGSAHRHPHLALRRTRRLSRIRQRYPAIFETTATLTGVIERVVSGRTKAYELARLLLWAWKAEQLAAAVDA
jgi:hypothetical protein